MAAIWHLHSNTLLRLKSSPHVAYCVGKPPNPNLTEKFLNVKFLHNHAFGSIQMNKTAIIFGVVSIFLICNMIQAQATVPLTATADPASGGNITSVSGSYAIGSQVNLSETTNPGWFFEGWFGLGKGSYTGGNTTANIIINGTTTETALFNNFQTNKPKLIVISNPSGGGGVGLDLYCPTVSVFKPTSSTYSASEPIGTFLSLCQQNFTGYVFKSWTCTGPGCSDGGYSGSNPSPQVSFNQNMTEVADFQSLKTAIIKVTSNLPDPQSGAGIMVSSSPDTSCSPSGGLFISNFTSCNLGSTVRTIAYTNTGYTFKNWTCTGPGCYSGTNYTTPNITIENNITETANFYINNEPSLVLKSTLGGRANAVPINMLSGCILNYSSSSAILIPAGTEYGLCEQNFAGYTFKNWTCTGPGCSDGGYSGSNPSPEIVINSNITETANFQINTTSSPSNTTPNYLSTLNIVANNGITSPSPGKSTYLLYEGSSTTTTIDAVPDPGYTFKNWTCTGQGCSDGGYSGTNLMATITLTPNSNITETANFQRNTSIISSIDSCVISTNVSPQASGYVTGATTFSCGSSVTLIPQNYSGYIFSNWTCSGNGCYSGRNAEITLSPENNITETANFKSAYISNTNLLCVDANWSGTGNVSENGYIYVSHNGNQEIKTSNHECSAYPHGSTVLISGISDPEYFLKNWTCTGPGCYSGTSFADYLTISSNINETANFVRISGENTSKPTLSIFADPGKGGSAFYNYSECITYNYTPPYTPNSSELNGYCSATAGTSIQITAKPAKGYLFNGWVGSGPGSYTGTNYNATIILNENITETASFQSSATSSKSIGSSSVSANSTPANEYVSMAISSLEAQLPNENISITNITAGSNNNTNTYTVQTQVNAKILFLFSVHYHATVSVNKSNGKIDSIQKPWWTFFTTK